MSIENYNNNGNGKENGDGEKKDVWKKLTDNLKSHLSGKEVRSHKKMLQSAEENLAEAVKEENYENAAILRDYIARLKKLMEEEGEL